MFVMLTSCVNLPSYKIKININNLMTGFHKVRISGWPQPLLIDDDDDVCIKLYLPKNCDLILFRIA